MVINVHIIALDNNQQDIELLSCAISENWPKGKVTCFSDPLLAIKYCLNHTADLVFSECSLKRMDGFAFVNMLRQRFPTVKAVLISDSDQYREEAERLGLGFADKPVNAQSIRKAMESIG